MVRRYFLPNALRRSRIRSVKLAVSPVDADIPAAELVGYSQSMSMPSSPNASTRKRQWAAKHHRQPLSAAISLKPPLPHPPTDSSTLSDGLTFFNATMLRKRSSLSMRTPSRVSFTWPKA